jgi:hypothetical protein
MEMINAAEEMAAGSQAGSVGRRLEDVQSEVGSSSGPLTTALPPTVESPFAGIFSQPSTTPTIYDMFSQSRGVHIIDEIGTNDHPTNDVNVVGAKARSPLVSVVGAKARSPLGSVVGAKARSP